MASISSTMDDVKLLIVIYIVKSAIHIRPRAFSASEKDLNP